MSALEGLSSSGMFIMQKKQSSAPDHRKLFTQLHYQHHQRCSIISRQLTDDQLSAIFLLGVAITKALINKTKTQFMRAEADKRKANEYLELSSGEQIILSSGIKGSVNFDFVCTTKQRYISFEGLVCIIEDAVRGLIIPPEEIQHLGLPNQRILSASSTTTPRLLADGDDASRRDHLAEKFFNLKAEKLVIHYLLSEGMIMSWKQFKKEFPRFWEIMPDIVFSDNNQNLGAPADDGLIEDEPVLADKADNVKESSSSDDSNPGKPDAPQLRLWDQSRDTVNGISTPSTGSPPRRPLKPPKLNVGLWSN
jgi:hypothetical protein